MPHLASHRLYCLLISYSNLPVFCLINLVVIVYTVFLNIVRVAAVIVVPFIIKLSNPYKIICLPKSLLHLNK